MNTERRKQILLGVLLVVLAIAVYRAVAPPQSPAGEPSADRGETPRPPARAGRSATDVRLDALDAEWPAPGSELRNLFQFGRARPVGGPPPPAGPLPPPVIISGPPPPAVPAIPLKLIGLVTKRESKETLAVLSDGRGVYYGHEGDVIEGRYRILRITTDAVELSHLDGRGRQMMRLGGS